MVFGPERDILDVVHKFLDFFVEESCGYCTPCRVGNVLLQRNDRRDHRRPRRAGGPRLPARSSATTVKTTSRCGLGQTSPNPVLTHAEELPPEYEKRMRPAKTRLSRNVRHARGPGRARRNWSGRKSVRLRARGKRREAMSDNVHIHDRRGRGHGQAGPDHPAGGGRGGRLHPAALRPRRTSCRRGVPGLHGAGQRPARRRPAPSRSPRAWSWRTTRRSS